jgi:gentisate 1,2-dioxygenase
VFSAPLVSTLEDLYPQLDARDMEPGWHRTTRSLWPEPRSTYPPRHWHYAHGRSALAAAGDLIGTDQAERRNLLLFNRVGDNRYATSRTIVAAYQMLKPGERARSHRHSPNALRLILEGNGGVYTTVDGERIAMETGDVVLTPGGCWHGHGNDGTTDSYWIDFLDVPLVHLLEPMFFDPHPDEYEPIVARPKASPYLFPWVQVSSRLRGETRIVLDTPSIPTLELSMQRIEAGEHADGFRTTANSVFAVVDGAGQSVVAGEVMEWARGDVFVVPAWTAQRHASAAGATLFCVSDAPVMRMLGFLRTAAAN